jgi:Tfp pilus assembly protein PilV
MHRRLGETMCVKYSKSNRRHKGLSIIEVAMASVLLIAAMVPILKNLTRAQKLSNEMERKTYSLVLAQNNLDKIKAFSIYNFDSLGSFVPDSNGSYLCNVTVSDVTPPNTDLKQITVSVGYDNNGNGTLTDDKIEVALATCFARRW